MFKQFDIDYDEVTIDGTIISKPKYMSVEEWHDFWKLFDAQSFDHEMSKSFDNGYETRKREEEQEIGSLKNHCYEEFDNIFDRFEKIFDNPDIGIGVPFSDSKREFKDWINRSRDEIWRL